MRLMSIALIVPAAALLAAGCSSTRLDQPAPVIEQSKAADAGGANPPASGSTVAKVEAPSSPVQDALNDPSGKLAQRSVYFDFDKSLVRPEYQPLIEAHGRYLVDHASRQILIEGNCDERGGREYNLALGQRRADAVRQRLELVGVPLARVETISYGKEKPRATGHDAKDWAENRRADLVYR